jgi:hypothetical protein
MMTRHSMLFVIAGFAGAAGSASAGWFSGEPHYIGQHHDAHFNRRFLERPCPPYHGWNRPFYGWSSNYRPYYFTPQSYANTPWNYGPGYQATVYQSAAPTPGLNAYGVPVQGSSESGVKPVATTPPVAHPLEPTLAPTVSPPPPAITPPAAVPQVTPPAVPQPPQPGLK